MLSGIRNLDHLDVLIDEGKAVREPALGYEDDGYYVMPIRFKDGSRLFWNDINETWHLRLHEAEKL